MPASPIVVTECVGPARHGPRQLGPASRCPDELGEIFVVPAAIAVQNAHVLAQAQRLAARLRSALETRGVIDRAVGIMMSRSGGTEDEALDRLRALSQNEHQRLALVAHQIVDEAVRRAQARHHSH